MAGAGLSRLPARFVHATLETWRELNFEQRVAGVGATLLIVSTFGPFSFVEGAIVLLALSVLLLLRRRAQGREFHVPFGDGTVIAAAGVWAAILILIRLFDRPLGQGLLALACAAIVFVAGLSERRKRLPDDLPVPDPEAHQRSAEATEPLAEWEDVAAPATRVRSPRMRRRRARAAPPADADSPPLPPPEYHPPGRREGADELEPADESGPADDAERAGDSEPAEPREPPVPPPPPPPAAEG